MLRTSSTHFPLICLLLTTASLAHAGSVVSEGDAAPGFELHDQNGNLQSLEDYRGKWVVLYFYPKDETPGCTREACEFRDDVFAFKKLNCQILGVSLDDSVSHRKFSEHHKLPFPLLADDDGTTADSYGVKTALFGWAIAKRQTYLINPQGYIVKHYAKVDPRSHSQQVLSDLQALQQ